MVRLVEKMLVVEAVQLVDAEFGDVDRFVCIGHGIVGRWRRCHGRRTIGIVVSRRVCLMVGAICQPLDVGHHNAVAVIRRCLLHVCRTNE